MYVWHYSNYAKEIYRYNKGVFEAMHHIPPKLHSNLPILQLSTHTTTSEFLQQILSGQTSEWKTDTSVSKKICTPGEITDPKEIETTIIQQNKRHLQQASIKEGRVHNPVMQN